MKLGERSNTLLGATRSRGKMYEYSVPSRFYIKLPKDPNRLFPLSIGILGDISEFISDDRFNCDFSEEQIKGILFSAHFLDAFYRSKLNPEIDEYLKSLIAASYYMASLPGSSLVFSKNLTIDFENHLFESFLNSILKSKITERDLAICRGRYPLLAETITSYMHFLETGDNKSHIETNISSVLEYSYLENNPRDLLLCDLSSAILKLKLNNSVWTILPSSSGIPAQSWSEVFRRNEFVKELWPSQKILAREGVFYGKSATIQMPTSAGKTKSTEIILRSFFFKNLSQSAVLVAPFKALCHEINDSLQESFHGEGIKVNEFTDVFQKDYAVQENRGLQIIITTPEKLVYILRQDPELAESIGLLILDEGHQFDNGIRGVTYELLVTSLKQMLSEETQWILISAVLSNAQSIHSWLNGENGSVISGTSLSPTQKTVGFMDWSKPKGQIKYVNPLDIDIEDYFVPRVIESKLLEKKGKETKDKFFPEKKDGATIALYLGLKVVHNGCVAIFCGQKNSVIKICKTLNNLYSRNYETEYPRAYSDEEELDKLSNLFRLHLGNSSSEANAVNLGVLTHHASLPHGLRLAVEYALREQKARVVVCTSTLAQGVNLPIRYLIFTNIYQAGEKISVRDFHNLAGRAGRAGMHTEGTILFANPEVYEKRKTRTDSWRWNLIKNILRPENSEPCSSSLLSIFSKILNNPRGSGEKLELAEPTINYLKHMIVNPAYKDQVIKDIYTSLSNRGFDEKTVSRQFNYKEKIINTIEGYLISNLPEDDEESLVSYVRTLTEKTLAFHLASEEQKGWLYELFELIGRSLYAKVPDPEKRSTYAKTLIGVNEIRELDLWVDNNLEKFINFNEDQTELLKLLWEVIFRYLPSNSIAKKLDKRKMPFEIVKQWVDGESFIAILDSVKTANCKYKAGSQRRNLTVQHIVDFCEGSIAFDGMLILGAIIELISSKPNTSDTLIPESLKHLQKSLKYGLSSEEEIRLFERDFSDREVAKTLASIFINNEKKVINKTIIELSEKIEHELEIFPSYFKYQYKILIEKIKNL